MTIYTMVVTTVIKKSRKLSGVAHMAARPGKVSTFLDNLCVRSFEQLH